jgi:ABC-type branched-subunit amino acid transport system substrate-binding protein
MNNNQSRREFCATAIATILASATSVKAAEKKYDAGASDTEIKVGQTVPHSGPGSLYGVLGRVGEAYFQMLNEKGGINGRKVKFFTMDDAYSAPKCVEATRRLVEQEEVLALFGSLGTAPQTAVHKYLNSKGVPQLLLNTGASKWNDPKNHKWTMAGLPLYPTEARILAKHVVSVKPNAKVGILYQNDDFGRDFLAPFKQVLADAGGTAKVIMEQTYDLTDPTIDSQLINLSKSGADVFYNISTGKASSQSIRKVVELGWKPCNCFPRVPPAARSSVPPALRMPPGSSPSAMPRKSAYRAGRRIPTSWPSRNCARSICPTSIPTIPSRSQVMARWPRWPRYCAAAATISRAPMS